MPSTLSLSALFDTEHTNKPEIESDAALQTGRTRKGKNLLQLGFGEVTNKKVDAKWYEKDLCIDVVITLITSLWAAIYSLSLQTLVDRDEIWLDTITCWRNLSAPIPLHQPWSRSSFGQLPSAARFYIGQPQSVTSFFDMCQKKVSTHTPPTLE